MEIFDRTARLIGEDKLELLKTKRVALFGLGGVGGACFEALIRAGLSEIAVIDGDKINESNINRQLLADLDNIGVLKTDAAILRAQKINPEAKIIPYPCFYTPQNADELDLSRFDFVIDAIDMVTAKIELALRCKELNIPIISCMGTGNKLDPTLFEIADLFKTSVCPLCRVMRRELSKRGIDSLTVLYSKEKPDSVCEDKSTPASISFVPPVAGMIIAGEVIKRLCDIK